ncbi:MAG: type II CAAX endopeptidase family protein [Desulfobacteraceae bacterium]
MSAIQMNTGSEKTNSEPVAKHKRSNQVVGDPAGRRTLSNYLPERYSIKSNGDERVLICLEAPNLNVHIEPGLAVNASMARKSPAGTIFLDGVAQCEPFMDHERQVYNLDHHEGCVRAFTLATCEQTLVMYMKGLDLRGREWHIFANDPDLDAILAIWILLNHGRIGRQDSTQRRILFALVRYEGIIDSLGLELKELSALPPELMRKIQRVVDHLRSDEIALKKEGRWEKTDFLTHTISILHKIDQIFFKPSDFEDYKGIEELARIDLTDQRIAAVVEADMGIYEIEPHLNKLYGNRLGVVFLKKSDTSYTARQMDLFMPVNLDDVYERLNFVDPAVKCRTQANKWGGATDIGGSPRDTGTMLTPLEIAQTCRDAVHRLGFGQQAYRFGLTAALIGLIVLCAQIIRLYWSPADWFANSQLHAFWILSDTGFLLTLATGTILSLLFIAYCRPWQYGWIRPVGNNWWFFLPVVLAAGFFGGVWMPESLQQGQSWNLVILLGILGIPLTAELLFRSLAHGLLTQGAKIQRNDTRWFMSWPIAGSTVVYVVYIMSLLLIGSDQNSSIQLGRLAISLSSAALFGLCLGMVRERSQSLFPAMLFHVLAAATAFIVTRLI